MDEFDFIAQLLAPLASHPAALGLKDDAAVLDIPAGQSLVVTKDAITEGVHFVGDEAASLIAQKLLRMNLSDLAAMGAMPMGYFLALLLPESVNEKWLKDFAGGLQADQKTYGITLLGGDTTRIGGPLALTITAMGLVPKGQALLRSGAKAGDAIYVSGTIGDAALGLTVQDEFLRNRYHLPQPRLELGQALRGIATSCMDISDGLMQDLGHICAASEVGAEINWRDVPLSEAARAALPQVSNPYETILAGGDDYELLFTVPPEAEAKLHAAAVASGTSITRIGQIKMGSDAVALDDKNQVITLKRKGYRHF